MFKTGRYKNKRGEIVQIEYNANGDGGMQLEHSDAMQVYLSDGTCFVWNAKAERYYMNAASGDDLVLKPLQAQDSLTDQINRVIVLANDAGEYDAADWIRKSFNSKKDTAK